MISPLSFTPEFRRKLAELPVARRREWLEALVTELDALPRDAAQPRASVQSQLREVARACRLDIVDAIQRQLGPFDAVHLSALLEVPRERFVRDEDLRRCADDTPLPLDDEGLATVSAPHAYVLSFRLLQLAPGDSLLELGSGSGYGAALASFIVGDRGNVTTVEIDPTLAAWSRRSLEPYPNVIALEGDAEERADLARNTRKIVVTFAVDRVPQAWLDELPAGGILVAPVGARERDQRLVRVRRGSDGELHTSEHGAVRYVQNRSNKPR